MSTGPSRIPRCDAVELWRTAPRCNRVYRTAAPMISRRFLLSSAAAPPDHRGFRTGAVTGPEGRRIDPLAWQNLTASRAKHFSAMLALTSGKVSGVVRVSTLRGDAASHRQEQQYGLDSAAFSLDQNHRKREYERRDGPHDGVFRRWRLCPRWHHPLAVDRPQVDRCTLGARRHG